MIHLYYNIFGTIIFLLGFYGLNVVFDFSFADNIVTAADIALIHTVFNVGSAIIFLPMPMVILLENWRFGVFEKGNPKKTTNSVFLMIVSNHTVVCHFPMSYSDGTNGGDFETHDNGCAFHDS